MSPSYPKGEQWWKSRPPSKSYPPKVGKTDLSVGKTDLPSSTDKSCLMSGQPLTFLLVCKAFGFFFGWGLIPSFSWPLLGCDWFPSQRLGR